MNEQNIARKLAVCSARKQRYERLALQEGQNIIKLINWKKIRAAELLRKRRLKRVRFIASLRSSGSSYAQIAREFGLSPGRIAKICAQAKKLENSF
jgi:hypothetical protein